MHPAGHLRCSSIEGNGVRVNIIGRDIPYRHNYNALKESLAPNRYRPKSSVSACSSERRFPDAVDASARALCKAHFIYHLLIWYPQLRSSLTTSAFQAPAGSRSTYTTPLMSFGVSMSPFLRAHTFSRPSLPIKYPCSKTTF